MLTDITKLETVDYDNDIQLDDLDDIIKVTGNTDKANLKKISKAQDDIIKVTGNTDKANLKKISKAQIAAKKKICIYIYIKKNLN